MKFPVSPKPFDELFEQEKDNLMEIAAIVASLSQDKYLHWDNLRHRTPPKGLSHEQWWLGLKLARIPQIKFLPLLDKHNKPFSCTTPAIVNEALHHIDSRGSGRIAMPKEVSNPETKTRFLVRSLIEEAITSSQLEGASTSRQKAMEMFRSGRRPADKSEQMIFNNLQGMELIQKHRHDKLTPELVFEIHKEMTRDTLPDEQLGQLQKPEDERVYVADNNSNTILHSPPPADELPERLIKMCDFANGKNEKEFLHPVIRAIVLHFWLAYDHPFSDGNGRTARALFYWSMLNSGYWIFEYISISSILKKASAQYTRSYLYTETDNNDLTYFIDYQLKVILRALSTLDKYLEKKTTEIQQAEKLLQDTHGLNYRQLALLSHALRKPHSVFTINSHQMSHRVAYATARADLLALVEKGLLKQKMAGNALRFEKGEGLDKLLNVK